MITPTKPSSLPLLHVVFAFGAAALAGCAADTDVGAPGGSNDADINGGRVEYGYAAAGALDTRIGGFCSGVLIEPDVVLTAAHCVLTDFGITPPEAFYLGRGEKTAGDAQEVSEQTSFTRHEVLKAAAFGTVDDILTSACPHDTADVALVLLAEPVSGVTPAKLADADPEPGETCTVVGYGHHYAKDGTSTKLLRRSARLDVVELLPQALHLKIKTGISQGGDSGGPLFCNRQVVGVTSCGDDLTYETDDYYARVTTVRKRIDSQIKRWHAR